MSNIYRCNARLKKMVRKGKRRVHEVCDAPNARPVFTAPLSKVTKDHSQPRWLCPRHEARFPHVSGIDGRQVEKIAKSYDLVEGRPIPIRG